MQKLLQDLIEYKRVPFYEKWLYILRYDMATQRFKCFRSFEKQN